MMDKGWGKPFLFAMTAIGSFLAAIMMGALVARTFDAEAGFIAGIFWFAICFSGVSLVLYKTSGPWTAKPNGGESA